MRGFGDSTYNKEFDDLADLSDSVTSETLLPIGDIIPNPVTTTFLIYLIKPTFNPSA
mgnify:CR=1 FL=1